MSNKIKLTVEINSVRVSRMFNDGPKMIDEMSSELFTMILALKRDYKKANDDANEQIRNGRPCA